MLLRDEYINKCLRTPENLRLNRAIKKEGYWLFEHKDDGGLGLEDDVDKLLSPYRKELLSGETSKFINGLDVLKEGGIISNNQYDWWLGVIKKKKNIKENGKWSILNKVNTNFTLLSFLLVVLVDRLDNDSEIRFRNYGRKIRNKILNNSREGLVDLERYFINLMIRYFPGIQKDYTEFKNFVRPVIEDTSNQGEGYENTIESYLSGFSFDIRYKGGDGDWLDMLLGIDMIVYHENYGLKRIQVKPLEFHLEDKKKYINKVEWLALTNNSVIKIMDIRTLHPIIIK